jgi:hypothetical protein
MMSTYVWYAGYGSNLNRQRFLCYIEGGTPLFGTQPNSGCTDKILPLDNRFILIPYRLYFAWPNDMPDSKNWGKGGVAFLDPQKAIEENEFSFVRIWKITSEQYEEIRDQEGKVLYDKEINIGELDGISIKTMTHSTMLDIQKPSATYLKTIMFGIQESGLNITDSINYLKTKEGIAGHISDEELPDILNNI